MRVVQNFRKRFKQCQLQSLTICLSLVKGESSSLLHHTYELCFLAWFFKVSWKLLHKYSCIFSKFRFKSCFTMQAVQWFQNHFMPDHYFSSMILQSEFVKCPPIGILNGVKDCPLHSSSNRRLEFLTCFFILHFSSNRRVKFFISCLFILHSKFSSQLEFKPKIFMHSEVATYSWGRAGRSSSPNGQDRGRYLFLRQGRKILSSKRRTRSYSSARHVGNIWLKFQIIWPHFRNQVKISSTSN